MTQTRGRIARAYVHGWNDALGRLRDIFEEMPRHLPALTTQHAAALRCLDAVAGQLAVGSRSLNYRTNDELAQRFGCCPRTIVNWRAEGAPLDAGKAAMIRWLGARRYVPAGTETLHHRQLDSARLRVLCRKAKKWSGRLERLRREQPIGVRGSIV